MRFCIEKVSDSSFYEEREINTMEELQALAEEHPGWHGKDDYKDLIVNFGNANNQKKTIIIYDDYIE